MFQFISFFSII